MKIYYVYILLCSDKTYYTGVTSDLSCRLMSQKWESIVKAIPFQEDLLNWYIIVNTDPNMAIVTEKRIKKWSQQKKKALIAGEYEKLPNLSKLKGSRYFFFSLMLQENTPTDIVVNVVTSSVPNLFRDVSRSIGLHLSS